jgi:ionotropic kainate glutamate receptor 2
MLYDRWWKRPGITCSRDDKSKEGKANALGVDNIGGVFVVLLGGLAVAILTAIIEFCISSKKNAQNQRVRIYFHIFFSYTYFLSINKFANKYIFC